MGYKTILIHANDERRIGRLVQAAAQLADTRGAHLIGLYVMPPVPTYGATAIGAGMIKSGLTAFQDEAKRVHAAFEAACAQRSITAEWRLVQPTHRDVADVLLDHGHAADLIVASQRDREWDYNQLLEAPERLVLGSGRPVLVVPNYGRFDVIGKRINVAWNNRKEAARAVFDAMPALRGADNVRLVWINPAKGAVNTGDLPTAEIATTLARHGVKCEASSTVADDIQVGDVLLSGLSDDGADLLVMGAYGHSRIREFVFGGATRHILDHMTVPVLLSH